MSRFLGRLYIVLIQRFVAAVIENVRFLTGCSVVAEPAVAVVDLKACRICGDIRSEHIKGLRGIVPVRGADALLYNLLRSSKISVACRGATPIMNLPACGAKLISEVIDYADINGAGIRCRRRRGLLAAKTGVISERTSMTANISAISFFAILSSPLLYFIRFTLNYAFENSDQPLRNTAETRRAVRQTAA